MLPHNEAIGLHWALPSNMNMLSRLNEGHNGCPHIVARLLPRSHVFNARHISITLGYPCDDAATDSRCVVYYVQIELSIVSDI